MYRILYGCFTLLVVMLSCGSNEDTQGKQGIGDKGNDDSLTIISRPIVFDSTRKRLSIEYIQLHYGLTVTAPVIHPRMIVIHHTANDDADSSFNTMNPASLPPARKDIEKGGSLNVAAHYLVDREGKIFRLLADTLFARHTIGLNMYAIGIENVGGNKLPLTAAQLESNVRLVRYLTSKYPSIQFMIGHKEYGNFKNSKLWLEKDSSYFTKKVDPAGDFMTQLRNRLSDLNLKASPM